MKKIVVILLVFAYIIYSVLIILTGEKNDIVKLFSKNNIVSSEVHKSINDPYGDSPYYDEYILINDDYIGHLVFDSGLIEKPIVQAKSCYRKDGSPYRFFEEDGTVVTDFSKHTGNDVYLWMDYQTMGYDYFETGGSLFMDFRNKFDDQNLVLYGHFFPGYDTDPDRVKGFTPLEKLLSKEGYENNKYVSLYLQKQKLDYELAVVFYYDDRDIYYQDYCQYYRPNFNCDDYNDVYDPNYCSNYFRFIDSIKLYDTSASLSPNDRTLTFQTCTANSDVYEICVFKLIKVSNY